MPASYLSGPFGPLSGRAAGLTPFGFDVPSGNPGAVGEAAEGVRGLGAALTDQGRTLSTAARAATGGWGGAAANSYSDYTSRVVAYGAAAAAGCDHAASALSAFADELAIAQAVTRQAFADCEQFQTEMNAQQVNVDAARTAAQIASGNAILAPHEPARAAFQHDLAVAEQEQAAAQASSDTAERGLQAAQQRGAPGVRGLSRRGASTGRSA